MRGVIRALLQLSTASKLELFSEFIPIKEEPVGIEKLSHSSTIIFLKGRIK